MGPLVALLAMIGVVVLWIFWSFQPRYANEKQLKAFNWMVIGVCTMLALVWVFNIESSMSGTVNEKWSNAISAGGAILIEIVLLFICFILRNFWIFNPKRKRW